MQRDNDMKIRREEGHLKKEAEIDVSTGLGMIGTAGDHQKVGERDSFSLTDSRRN